MFVGIGENVHSPNNDDIHKMWKDWCIDLSPCVSLPLSLFLSLYNIYMCICNILRPIWKYTCKGFPPPHPTPCIPMLGPPAERPGGAWGGVAVWAESLLGIFP